MNIVALKVFAAVAAIFIASGAITLAIVNPNVSGFAGLLFGNLLQGSAQNGQGKLDAGLVADGTSSNDKNAGNDANSGGLSGSISYEVIGFTKLDANLFSGTEIPECPGTADVSVEIKNSGKYAAEKISIGANSGFVVMACDGCSIEKLESGAEKEIKMKLCRSAEQELTIAIAAVNANPLELIKH